MMKYFLNIGYHNCVLYLKNTFADDSEILKRMLSTPTITEIKTEKGIGVCVCDIYYFSPRQASNVLFKNK